MTTNVESNVTKTAEVLTEAIAEAREVLRELHGATKDLRQAITDARQLPRRMSEQGHKRLMEVLEWATGELDFHATALTLRLTEGMPINILCSRCGHTLACIDLEGVPLHCGHCGHKFMLRQPDEGRAEDGRQP